MSRGLVVPLGCYLAVALVVPLLRGGLSRPGFVHHALVVCGTIALLARRGRARGASPASKARRSAMSGAAASAILARCAWRSRARGRSGATGVRARGASRPRTGAGAAASRRCRSRRSARRTRPARRGCSRDRSAEPRAGGDHRSRAARLGASVRVRGRRHQRRARMALQRAPVAASDFRARVVRGGAVR